MFLGFLLVSLAMAVKKDNTQSYKKRELATGRKPVVGVKMGMEKKMKKKKKKGMDGKMKHDKMMDNGDGKRGGGTKKMKGVKKDMEKKKTTTGDGKKGMDGKMGDDLDSMPVGKRHALLRL